MFTMVWTLPAQVSMYHFTKEPISSLGYGEGKVMRAWGPELDTEFEVTPLVGERGEWGPIRGP